MNGDLAPQLSPVDVSEIAGDYPALLKQVRKLEPNALLARVAALLANPHNHPNTIRLEVLAHLAFAYSRGQVKPSRALLDKLLNKVLSETRVALLQDPVEDVFVSSVASSIGNTRLFLGLWASADHYLQDALACVFKSPRADLFVPARKPLLALLKLSEEFARRTGVDANELSGGQPRGRIRIPTENVLNRGSRRAWFDSDDLGHLGLSLDDLAPFTCTIPPLSPGEKIASVIGASSLERRPLVRVRDRLILALPTAVSLAIRRFLVEISNDADDHPLPSLLRVRQSSQCFEVGLNRLGDCEPLEGALDPAAELRPAHVDSVVGRFDSDKLVHVVVVHDPIERSSKRNRPSHERPRATTPLRNGQTP